MIFKRSLVYDQCCPFNENKCDNVCGMPIFDAEYKLVFCRLEDDCQLTNANLAKSKTTRQSTKYESLSRKSNCRRDKITLSD